MAVVSARLISALKRSLGTAAHDMIAILEGANQDKPASGSPSPEQPKPAQTQTRSTKKKAAKADQ